MAASSIAFALALVRGSRKYAVVGWGLASPMLLYLAMTPGFRYSAPIAWCALGLSAWSVRDHRGVTVALLLPAVVQIVFLAVLVAAG